MLSRICADGTIDNASIVTGGLNHRCQLILWAASDTLRTQQLMIHMLKMSWQQLSWHIYIYMLYIYVTGVTYCHVYVYIYSRFFSGVFALHAWLLSCQCITHGDLVHMAQIGSKAYQCHLSYCAAAAPCELIFCRDSASHRPLGPTLVAGVDCWAQQPGTPPASCYPAGYAAS